MCGRYFIETDAEETTVKDILDEVNEKYKDTPELSQMSNGEIFPTNIVPVITTDEPVLMKWGFPRFDGKGQIINARLETADEKPMFRKAFAGQRCLVPASYYFEWETIGTKKKKYAIGLKKAIFMAGLYRLDSTSKFPLFVILTQPAARDIAFIHERMPVILAEEYHKGWLSGSNGIQEITSSLPEHLLYSEA